MDSRHRHTHTHTQTAVSVTSTAKAGTGEQPALKPKSVLLDLFSRTKVYVYTMPKTYLAQNWISQALDLAQPLPEHLEVHAHLIHPGGGLGGWGGQIPLLP